ncbi:hypothetical protein HAX54_040097, partial [Datura stramonium]|nr:hypothetical protein [Datura stramonium]
LETKIIGGIGRGLVVSSWLGTRWFRLEAALFSVVHGGSGCFKEKRESAAASGFSGVGDGGEEVEREVAKLGLLLRKLWRYGCGGGLCLAGNNGGRDRKNWLMETCYVGEDEEERGGCEFLVAVLRWRGKKAEGRSNICSSERCKRDGQA